MRKLSSDDPSASRYDQPGTGCVQPEVVRRDWGSLMPRSGSAQPSTDVATPPKDARRAGRSATRARLVVTVAVLVVAGTLASGAIRVTSESIPGAIQLGQVPAAAIPADRAGLHLVGSRRVDVLTGSALADGSASSSTPPDRGDAPANRASATTGPGAGPGGSSGATSPRGGSGESTPSTPALPGITLPGLSNPPATTLPGASVPSVSLPPVTVPTTTLPGVTVPSLGVPTTVTLPKIPLLDFTG